VCVGCRSKEVAELDTCFGYLSDRSHLGFQRIIDDATHTIRQQHFTGRLTAPCFGGKMDRLVILEERKANLIPTKALAGQRTAASGWASGQTTLLSLLSQLMVSQMVSHLWYCYGDGLVSCWLGTGRRVAVG
jgi:hypothetical protein